MKKYFLFAFLLIGAFACTDLEEELREDLTASQALSDVQVDALLNSAYDGLRLPYQDQAQFWAAQEHTSDEAIGPTRGPDWDDNGVWRVLHNHEWNADHAFLGDTFSALLQVVYGTTDILNFNPTSEQEAEARFLRAFVMSSVVDGWGQVPFREAGTSLLDDAPVLSAQETVDFIVSECDAILANLPDGPANTANKDAARVLLMKILLNKGAYLSRATPSFDAADMNRVISLADDIINSGQYSLADNYFDNFAPNNTDLSTENIWVISNETGVPQGGSGNSVRSRWFCSMHYNQNPSGWNGFTTLGDFYMSFEDSDVRKKADYAGVTEATGVNAGFLFGQQFDADGNPLMDRKGNDLSFTKEVALKESGDNLEITGIRVVKYPPDINGGDNVGNDLVLYRYADVLLMKAEAELRNGNAGTALSIVNDIRSSRGASTLGSIDLDELLAERGRELYWEGHRRTDLIRFGRFLDAWEEKPASGEERLLFPIPTGSLASNPNLTQNPGY
ncbi:MAG: RagB/SusD family nutrient uptake outer membrane protein [Saprospiraceae bacterium]|nr:RagB/SusD family nutrient uptake outer membrane protein [Bacteroidia bacterium]MBT8229054.1 RagB/SusD family nutrient uptake outer membrane protein [Bacteroidia bacterium]NNF22347.1 RagB/SusD family nutrient uptake outer membrane protein [Saprospiraceae bacterium]NNK90665.1 RagB/SusD family nutrient uptake outer membrane protein [Saprospiraceae bacterium]